MKNKYDIKEFCFVPPPYGGVSVYVKRLIDKLNVDNYKVGGFYLDTDDHALRISPLYDSWKWMQMHLFPIKIWEYLKIVRPYKIVHSHFSLEGMPYFWVIKNWAKKKIVITVHNSMVSNYYAQTNVVNRFFLNKMLRSKDVCWITVSGQGKEQLMSLPVKPISPVHVIPAYVPIVDIYYTPLPADMQKYIDSHKNCIAFYGHSFMQNNGIDVYGFRSIIEVYANIVNSIGDQTGLVLCISDNHDTKRLEEIHEYAKFLGVDDFIYWQIGAIGNIRTLWKKVNIYVRPTSTDGDSVAIREALDEGTIVIASDVCKRPEGVITYKFGDEKDLLQKISRNINSPKRKVKLNFKYYEMMKKIYDDLLVK